MIQILLGCLATSLEELIEIIRVQIFIDVETGVHIAAALESSVCILGVDTLGGSCLT